MTQQEQRRMEAIRTTHLRPIQYISYVRHVPNWAVRMRLGLHTVESHLLRSRLRLWADACRDSPHSFLRAALFGTVAGSRPQIIARRITLQGLIKDVVSKLQEGVKVRDRCLDPVLQDTAERIYRAHAPSGIAYSRRYNFPGTYDWDRA